jgi:hypothetical protein
MRSEVRIDTRLRHLKAYRPERWGEAMTVRNVEIDNFDLSQLDDQSLKGASRKLRRIAEIEQKSRIARSAA